MVDALPALRAQTAALLETLDALDDLDHPSLCEGWSRAHVLTHLARNADGLTNLARAAHGEALTMYASFEQRNADIASGATREPDVIVADCVATARSVVDALAGVGPELADVQVDRFPGGPGFPARLLPLMRLREVAYHHVDLEAGFGFDSLPDSLQRHFLADEVDRLQALPQAPGLNVRTAEGDEWTVGDGTASVTGRRAAVLGWLARGVRDGVEGDLPDLPAGP